MQTITRELQGHFEGRLNKNKVVVDWLVMFNTIVMQYTHYHGRSIFLLHPKN